MSRYGLIDAIIYKWPKEVSEALAAGDSPDTVNPTTGERALHMAARVKDGKVLRLLLQAGAEPDVQVPSTGSTPLHIAAMQGGEGNVEVLLRHGANALICDQRGNTALHLVSSRQDIPMLETLLRAGIPYDAANKEGKTAEALMLGRSQQIGIRLLAAKRELGGRIQPASMPDALPPKAALLAPDGPDDGFNPRNIGFWPRFDAVAQHLKDAGTPLQSADMRYADGTHLLDAAAFFFAEDKALSTLAAQGAGLGKSDVFRADGTAYGYVDAMERCGTLARLFQPELWAGRSVGELRNTLHCLYERYPETAREQVGHMHQLAARVSELQNEARAIGR